MGEYNVSAIVNAATRSGVKGGAGGLLTYLYYYASEVIKWDLSAILQPENLETLITWAFAFFGITGTIAGWNKVQPPPTVTEPINVGPVVEKNRVGPPPLPDDSVTTGPTPYKWSSRSRKMLATVHPDLRILATAALAKSPYDFGIAYPTGGKRSIEMQKELIKKGASKLLNSRHLHGMAIDIVVYDENGRYTEKEKYYREVERVAFKQASIETGIPYRWGGNWIDFIDTPHYELPRKLYPDQPDVILT